MREAYTIPRRPKGYGHWVLTVYRVADPQWTAGVNRIMGRRIGWFVALGQWSVGVCKPTRYPHDSDASGRQANDGTEATRG